MGAKRKTEKALTAKQAAFVNAYLKTRNATRSAIAAGYSKRSATTEGPRLLENAGVAKAIAALTLKAAKRAEVTAADVLEGLRREAEGLGEDTCSSARISAWSWLGKALQLFTENVHHTGEVRVIDPYAEPKEKAKEPEPEEPTPATPMPAFAEAFDESDFPSDAEEDIPDPPGSALSEDDGT